MDLANEVEVGWKLFDGFTFLKIEFAERQRYNSAALLIAIVVTLFYAVAPQKPHLIGDDGVLKDLQDFVQLLFPFFVGALAAVATFSREGLDELTVGGKARIIRAGFQHDLTRRQFVCYILGYCASLSVFIFIFIIGAKLLRPIAVTQLGKYLMAFKVSAVAIFSLSFAHLMIITLWSLYYMANRLVR